MNKNPNYQQNNVRYAYFFFSSSFILYSNKNIWTALVLNVIKSHSAGQKNQKVKFQLHSERFFSFSLPFPTIKGGAW